MKRATFTKNLQPVLAGAVGFAVGKQLNRIGFLNSNPGISAGAKILIGLVASNQRNAMVSNAAVGVAIAGATELVSTLLPSLAVSGIGLLPSSSTNVHSVAATPMVVVE